VLCSIFWNHKKSRKTRANFGLIVTPGTFYITCTSAVAALVRTKMPVDIACVTVKSNYGLTQNATLLQLGRDACDAAEQAQLAHGDEKKQLLDLSQALRERELAGWMATKTHEKPNGELLGASMAAMGIGNVHLLRGTELDIQLAREWYNRAEELCPTNDDAGVVQQRNNIKSNKMQLQLFEATRFLHKRVVVHGLISKPEYNGRRGRVLAVRAPGRYEVLLDAIKSEIKSEIKSVTDSKIEGLEVLLSVHCKNLHIV